MDVSELEVNLFIAGDAKLHGGMCKMLSTVVNRVLEIFPFIEAARPRSKSGIQALCSLHVAVGKAKSLLRHCADCSKLYLAITGDSICMKFEKARCELKESLRRVEDIVPEEIGSQIMEIVGELEGIEFLLDPSEKELGDDVISLFLIEGKIDTTRNDSGELEIFHQAAFKLGITSSRAALTERRALKKLIEKACAEGDKRKESIVSYLLNLLRRYSKHFRGEVADDTDSQGSTPCSPTVLGSFVDVFGPGGNNHALEKHFSKLSSLNFKQNRLKSGNLPPLPEEFRCPISLQLMYDPVIISSGQTYERVCIEKWFNDGHVTCPKTQQQLSHLSVTPNYCVKGLIASWCEHNGITIPHSPPESLDVSYWRLALSECEATDSRSMGSINTCKPKCLKVVPLEESCIGEELKGNEMGTTDNSSCIDHEVDGLRRYESLLSVLYEDHSMKEQCRTVEQLRLLLKDDEEARIYMGANGVVEALVQFLRSAVQEGDNEAQKAGAMALFNLIVSNSRNKGMLLSSGVLPLLEQMISGPETCESATALYLNLSCLDEAKPAIASSQAIPFLVQFLQSDDFGRSSCKHDALYTLYNLSTKPGNIPIILGSGFVDALHSIITSPAGPKGLAWTEKALAIFINLASSGEGKEVIASTPGLIGSLAAVLDTGEPAEQEQSASCLLILCSGDERCSHMVLQEGVVPSLVSLSVSGSQRGRERAQKLLKLFREQRQREPLPAPRVHEQHPTEAAAAATGGGDGEMHDSKPVGKPRSKRKRLIQTLSSFWKNKNFAGVSVLECMNRRPCKSF